MIEHQGWGSVHRASITYKDCYIDSAKVTDVEYDMDEKCNKYDVEVVLKLPRMLYEDAHELLFNSIGVKCEVRTIEQWYPTEEDRRRLEDD